jgi:hypothetical protein
MSDQPVNPLINLTSAIFRGVSGAPSRSKTVAPEPIPQTPPPAAVTSRAASTETASASLKSGQGGNLIYHKEHRPVPHNSQDPRAKPRKGLEKQQDSSREESNMEESLLDRDDPIEVDDDYVEVSSDTISREEQRVRPSGRTHLKSSRDKVYIDPVYLHHLERKESDTNSREKSLHRTPPPIEGHHDTPGTKQRT